MKITFYLRICLLHLSGTVSVSEVHQFPKTRSSMLFKYLLNSSLFIKLVLSLQLQYMLTEERLYSVYLTFSQSFHKAKGNLKF
jgi:hypothetical protein